MCSPLNGFLLIVSLKTTIDKWRIRFWFCGLQFISAVCCTPRRSSPWCAQRLSLRCEAHRGDNLRWTQVVRIKKNWRSKISWHTPFKITVKRLKVYSIHKPLLIIMEKRVWLLVLYLDCLIKGTVWRDFLIPLSNPYGPLINRLKWLLLKFRFCKDIRIFSSKSSTARSQFILTR